MGVERGSPESGYIRMEDSSEVKERKGGLWAHSSAERIVQGSPLC